MDSTALISIIITILLSVTGISLIISGFFLKDIYKEYQKLVKTVNLLDANFFFHVKLYNRLHEHYQRELKKINEKVDKNKMN